MSRILGKIKVNYKCPKDLLKVTIFVLNFKIVSNNNFKKFKI